MSRVHRIGVLLLAALFPFAAHAQWSVASPVVDLGQVTEGQAPRAQFTLRNGGLVPLRVVRLEADCRLRVLRRPQGFIAPASRAVVEVELLTPGRLGVHELQLSVHHTGWADPVLLTVRAQVVRAEGGAFRGRDTVSRVVLSTLREALPGLVRASQPREFTLRALNLGSKPIEVFDSLRGPFELVPPRLTLLPGQPQQLLLRYRPGARIPTASDTAMLPGVSRWCAFTLAVPLFTTDSLTPRIPLTLVGVFDPGPPAAESLATLPQASFDKLEAFFRSAQPGSTATFTVRNRGAAALRLTPQPLAGGELRVVAADSLIAPGGLGRLSLRYEPPLRQPLPPRGTELRRSLPVATNDPRLPLVVLTLHLGQR